MKRKSLVITASLAMLFGLGIAGGLSARKAAKEVKADIDVDFGNSGKVFLRLDTNDWKYTGSKIALYMFNDTESKNAWGGFVTPSATSKFVEYSYSLDFTPEACIAFRFDPGVETCGQWCFDDNRGNSAI